MYCAWRIPAHLKCTQCSILLHLMDICFLTCICLWQISQIQTCLFKVVGPGLVSTSPAFVSSSASHPASPHGRHAQKNGKSGPHWWGREGSTQFAQSAVTAAPLVGCVVWSHYGILNWDTPTRVPPNAEPNEFARCLISINFPHHLMLLADWQIDADLNRTVRKFFSSLRQAVGKERLLRAASTSCLYLSQLSFFRLT